MPIDVAATEDNPIPKPATAIADPTRTAEVGLSSTVATAMPIRPRPAAMMRSFRWRASRRAAAAEPPMTRMLNGSSVAAAASGVRPSVPWRKRVSRVATSLVVAVLRNARRFRGGRADHGARPRQQRSRGPTLGEHKQTADRHLRQQDHRASHVARCGRVLTSALNSGLPHTIERRAPRSASLDRAQRVRRLRQSFHRCRG